MFHVPLDAVVTAALLIASAVGAAIARKIKTPTDSERAELLTRIALDAARLTASMYPRAPWRDLLESTVKAIASAAGVPTSNLPAIQRAAASALVVIGKQPNG